MHLALPRARTLVAAVTLGVASLAAGPSIGAASAAAIPAGECVSASLTAYSQLTFTDVGQPGPSPGDEVAFHDELDNTAGNLVGTEDGTGHLFAATDGLNEFMQANADVNGGTLFWDGPVDIPSSLQGQEQVMRTTGTGGAFQGMTGTWSFVLVRRLSPTLSLFSGSYTLCKP